MSDLWDDPDFVAYVDDFISYYGTPPSTGDILMYFEAKASVALDREDGTYRV